MNVFDAYPSKYLKHSDLAEGDVKAVIRAVEVEEMGQGEDREVKPVLYFEGADKGLVLNKTNATTLAEMFSPETEDWLGKEVTLFVTQVDFAGRTVDAIRIKKPRPKPPSGKPAFGGSKATALDQRPRVAVGGGEKPNSTDGDAPLRDENIPF